MYRTQNSLSAPCELLDQVANSPGSLRVQTRRRFVEEEQQFRPGRQLDTNGQSLALLDIEALARLADNGTSKILHLEHRHNTVNVSQLVLPRNASGLAQQRAELDCLAHRHGFEVQVLLLHVADTVLEGGIGCSAIYKCLARQDACGDPSGKDVE